METKRCKLCGLIMRGTPYETNPSKIMWLHPYLKACTKVKPITRLTERTRHNERNI